MRKSEIMSASSPALLGGSYPQRRPATVSAVQLRSLAWKATPFDVDAEHRRIEELTSSYAPSLGGRHRKSASFSASSRSTPASRRQMAKGGLGGLLHSPGGVSLTRGLSSAVVARLEAVVAADEGPEVKTFTESRPSSSSGFSNAMERLKKRNLEAASFADNTPSDAAKQKWLLKLEQERRQTESRGRRSATAPGLGGTGRAGQALLRSS